MIKKLHHLGIAVSNLDEGISLYEKLLGSKPLFTKDIPEKQARVAIFKLGEDVEIELLSATGPECDIKEFIDAHGQGIHHIALAVDDLVSELKSIEQKGIQLRDREPRRGVAGPVAFLEPESTQGVFIELTQPMHKQDSTKK
jgi:methylmalonyl-CoA/ethylmalonyl-CoA epimerase